MPQKKNSLLPIVAEVDVVVVGGTSSAVSYALSAKRAGASVFVISSRPFMGEDICGLYRYWPEAVAGNSLSGSIFPDAEQPPTPIHVKLTLEQSLVQADIPFLFNCFPAGLLRTESGAVQGVAIANRTGLQAIRARLVVDATLDGLVLKQAGHSGVHAYRGKQDVEFVTLCEGEGEDAEGINGVEALAGYQSEDYSLSARRYTTSVDFQDGSPRALADAYGELVDRCWVKPEYRHQSRVQPKPAKAGRDPEIGELLVEPGLLGLTESIQLSKNAEACFANPHSAMRLGEAFGKCVFECLAEALQGDLEVSCANSVAHNLGDLRTLHDALRPGASSDKSVTFDAAHLPILGSFDVVVAGGGTGGAPAAISAGRTGASTLVVELTSGLGGVGTMGQIARYWHGNRVGFTSEIDKGVDELEYREDFKQDSEGWSVGAKSAWYHQKGREEGCTYWFNTLCVGTCVEGDRVVGILVAGPCGYGLVKAGCVVDSTGCSDIPACAGAPTVVIGKDHIAVQGTGLAGMKPGREYHNSDHNFSDDTDIVDATAMLTSAKLKFKDDFDCGELIDSRERRQIVGDYAISAVDILYERRFPDTICVATSNFDSHGFTIDPVFMLKPADKKVQLWADIPLRCLLPQGLDGVLVTGLGMSAHRDALPVIRMQADVQNQGYASGYIAAMSARLGQPIRDLDISAIKAHLVSVGNLPERVLDDVDTFPVAETAIQEAINDGWDELGGLALILYEKKRSLPLLKRAYEKVANSDTTQSIRYAQLLAFLGSADGQEELQSELAKRSWDEGWRFRGMHQFGMTLSEVDNLFICLGLIGDAEAWPTILDKIQSVPNEAEFSHFRAISIGCEALYARHPERDAEKALLGLLHRPGYMGYAQSNISHAQRALTGDINENKVREHSLREIHLAKALFNCGDSTGEGRAILEAYAQDCRGHFARHAKAVLAASSFEQPSVMLAGAK